MLFSVILWCIKDKTKSLKMLPICVGFNAKALVAFLFLPFAAGAIGDVSRQSKFLWWVENDWIE